MSTTWRNRLVLSLPLLAVAGLAAFTPSDDGPTVCPFALCTGMACPGCGMTRAASHLIRGDLDLALRYHPLVPLTAIAAVAGWSWFTLRLIGVVRPLSQRTLNLILIGSGVALVAVWLARVLNGTLPPV